MPLTKGTSFAGFMIVQPLGSGSTGETYVAEHPTKHGHYFLKILSNEISDDAEFRERFRRETRAVRRLSDRDHHIVPVHLRGENGGWLWTLMDYIDGPNIGDLLQQRHPDGIPMPQLVSIVKATARALDHAHRHGLLHRDVKPSKILLTPPEAGKRQILLSGFGLAPPIHGATGSTSTNIAFDTIDYAAPEQLEGERHSERADQYAL